MHAAAKAKTVMNKDVVGTLHKNRATIVTPYVGSVSPLLHESLLTRGSPTVDERSIGIVKTKVEPRPT